jgi:ATP synthase, F1 gamma subunit
MSGSMQSIKRRMKSVESTKKITRAMQLVATSKLRKMRNLLEQQKPYYTIVYDTVAHILATEDVKNHPFLKPNGNSKSAVILITSSLGLCGGYNSNVLKCAKENIQDGDFVYVLGSKGLNHYKEANFKYIDLSTDLSFTEVKELVKELMGKYQQQEIGRIKIIYTEFVNNLTFTPHCVKLLPITKEDQTKLADNHKVKYFMDFEPNASEVLKELIPMYLQATIYGYLIESVTSENASRRTSMENATDNATDLNEQLLLKYNQARQTAITNEISEIVAGANAQ